MNKEQFTSAIGALQKQRQTDLSNSLFVDKMFPGDSGLYDNTALIKAIVQLLQIHFPKDSKGHCEIEFWLFEQNFGKCGNTIVSVEELWGKLNKE